MHLSNSRFPLICATIIAAIWMSAPALSKTGRLVKWPDVISAHVAPRNVTIWLPDGYETDSDPYAVLYMHDGQNVFESETANFGEEWGVDEALSNLIARGAVRKTIVVGISSTTRRFSEYLPAAPIERLSDEAAAQRTQKAAAIAEAGGAILSDQYLRFIVEELKPRIDREFRTQPDRENTFIMGSSMGGLISLYALVQYPEIFSAAGCVSTHWPMSTDRALLADIDGPVSLRAAAYRAFLAERLPQPGAHRFYFDYGTINLDALYEPFQIAADEVFRGAGYRLGQDFISRRFDGADHNEISWRARINEPLLFLLAPPRDDDE